MVSFSSSPVSSYTSLGLLYSPYFERLICSVDHFVKSKWARGLKKVCFHTVTVLQPTLLPIRRGRDPSSLWFLNLLRSGFSFGTDKQDQKNLIIFLLSVSCVCSSWVLKTYALCLCPGQTSPFNIHLLHVFLLQVYLTPLQGHVWLVYVMLWVLRETLPYGHGCRRRNALVSLGSGVRRFLLKGMSLGCT